MSRWLRVNALSVAMLGAFVVFVILQSVFGWQVRNEELLQYGAAADSYLGYLTSGHFAEALFENWESEFLQMGTYVLLTAYLVQRGSAESKPEDQSDRPDDNPDHATAASPWPVHLRGVALTVYRNSLSIALLLLFAASFVLHVIGGAAEYNEQQALASAAPPISAWQFLATSDFWFQSMQNWQSEFLAVGALVLLSIVLRQHASPESKPVTAPHSMTGS
ncbi:hypothetical protein SAMN05444365_10265 [Micromonospora pattaloongensis]|uniref:Transmembrane protein n=1 Tax=Micromonospora pattaloongensis TaxID=405436 RepID=A0A1H3JE98_9ACTN|nr:DUF6766 family protein [Micromonospora pattaloongensis]SDY37909.1 hypothetical protein SAMN05444365_10265 [Micromonospora pattaloongensis]